jgi:hypothetical protein
MRLELLTERTRCRFRYHDEDHPEGPRDACGLRPSYHGFSDPFIRRSDLYAECKKVPSDEDCIPDDCPLWEGLQIRAVRQGEKVRFMTGEELAKL